MLPRDHPCGRPWPGPALDMLRRRWRWRQGRSRRRQAGRAGRTVVTEAAPGPPVFPAETPCGWSSPPATSWTMRCGMARGPSRCRRCAAMHNCSSASRIRDAASRRASSAGPSSTSPARTTPAGQAVPAFAGRSSTRSCRPTAARRTPRTRRGRRRRLGRTSGPPARRRPLRTSVIKAAAPGTSSEPPGQPPYRPSPTIATPGRHAATGRTARR
jgi:hypothetical protein